MTFADAYILTCIGMLVGLLIMSGAFWIMT